MRPAMTLTRGNLPPIQHRADDAIRASVGVTCGSGSRQKVAVGISPRGKPSPGANIDCRGSMAAREVMGVLGHGTQQVWIHAVWGNGCQVLKSSPEMCKNVNCAKDSALWKTRCPGDLFWSRDSPSVGQQPQDSEDKGIQKTREGLSWGSSHSEEVWGKGTGTPQNCGRSTVSLGLKTTVPRRKREIRLQTAFRLRTAARSLPWVSSPPAHPADLKPASPVVTPQIHTVAPFLDLLTPLPHGGQEGSVQPRVSANVHGPRFVSAHPRASSLRDDECRFDVKVGSSNNWCSVLQGEGRQFTGG
ncbi:uncharacterized protein LOC125083880 isoform X2 [Lutra lutra]|uniref:uncharacterized protein LOC125083880 isoform X2 n=1 Tax=Lutra lutra TaxID=9657 RepID=UPI001FD55E4E|nr:uncharacterized protein LOC125083880 isoform X2 [Lutra lutra]